MDHLFYIGQWQGFFQYGPEYGDFEGQEAEFRLFVEGFTNGQFSGRIIDWDGFGVSGEVSLVTGFIKQNFISFTKQYSSHYSLDEYGNSVTDADLPGHKVIYEGIFDPDNKTFVGRWEIVTEVSHSPNHTVEELLTGTWRMYAQE